MATTTVTGGGEVVDASKLGDETRIRRTLLAEEHTAALRSGDAAAVKDVEKRIQAEYKDDPLPAPPAP